MSDGEDPQGPCTDRMPPGGRSTAAAQSSPALPAAPACSPTLPPVSRAVGPSALPAAAAAPPPAYGSQSRSTASCGIRRLRALDVPDILHRKLARLPSWFDMLDAELVVVVVESKRSVRPATVITQVLVPSQHAMRQRVQSLVWVLIAILCVAGLAVAYLLKSPPGPSTDEVLETSRRTVRQAEQVLRDVEQKNAELDRRREDIENRGELIELK